MGNDMRLNDRTANWTAVAGVIAVVAIASFGGVAWITNIVDTGTKETLALMHERDTAVDRRITTLEAQRVGEVEAISRLIAQVDKLHDIEADLNIAVQRLGDLAGNRKK